MAVVHNCRRSNIRFRERSRRSFAHSAVKRPPTAAVAGATCSRVRAFARSRLWTAVEEVELPHVQLLDREGIVARVAPTSFIAELPATAARTSSIKSEHLSKDASEPIELRSVCELFVWQHLPEPRDEARAKFRLDDRQKCPSVAVSVKFLS